MVIHILCKNVKSVVLIRILFLLIIVIMVRNNFVLLGIDEYQCVEMICCLKPMKVN